MILKRIVEDGDTSGLSLLADEMAHLPKARDFAASTEMMARAFRVNRELAEDESLMLHAHKLASMSKRMFKDRETLKPVLERVRAALAAWAAWAEADDPTEEEIQEHLERAAEAMADLNAALNAYDSFVLAKLKENRGME
jgi:DNA-binding SARP family transcriptional activator